MGSFDIKDIRLPLVLVVALVLEGVALFFFLNDRIDAKIAASPPSEQTKALIDQKSELNVKDVEHIKKALERIDRRVENNHREIMEFYRDKK